MGQVDGFLTYKRHSLKYEEVKERTKHYKEFAKPVSAEETNEQAARCMDCGIPFCHSGCPLGNKIPDFNDAVYRNEFKEAWSILKSTNNFPEFTGRICPAPCEGSCVLGLNNDPVSIEHIEKTIAEEAFAQGWETSHTAQIKSGKSAAVIGSGPAGLAAADQLCKQGHEVTVFERDTQPGGLLRFGIPDFKLEKSVVERRVNLMKESGITFECGVEIGKDITTKEIEDKFDAIAICTGSTIARDLPIPGRELEGIHLAMKFLKNSNKVVSGEDTEVVAEMNAKDKHVIVIGGGDTGSDCVGTSIRQGAKSVTQIELLDQPSESRTEDNPWPEWPMVLRTSTSQKEGCERNWSVLTKEFIGNDKGEVTGLRVVDVEWTDKASFKFEEIEGTERVLPCERAYLAIGFMHPQKEGLLEQLGIETDQRGNIKDDMYRTNKENVFAAGDCRRGQSLVVWAISEGRKAAYSINKFLTV
ncbi:MAG: glutamate synthase subunit beta [Reichenbachiella sp.]|uniref:glutamate synthase subunit beta n=1 Tax=Reichenbachiella sp. TaxID=2184521 RepID=UPI0032658498